jgi:hypothetical protein
MIGPAPRIRRLDLAGLALLSYVPFLLSSPGKVSADTKQYLYLDPGRLLARSAYLWSDHLGTGTVPHQGIGYLFPMGPYYWAMDQLGMPDWIAQRLWMGSISFAAAVGALWLLTMLGTRRSGALVGALVYVLTPYQIAFTARISVLLLPWAALPWLVGLTARALARRGWRDPALFALVALAAGSVNATALLLVGIAPVLWLVLAVVQRRASIAGAAATGGRIALLTIGVSLWWAVGLVMQSRYGFAILDATESLARVSGSTLPADLARGFGNWFLSGSDRLGPWLEQATDYRNEKLLTVVTLAVPLAAFVAAACLRWRHRAYFVVLVVVGVVVGVGAWPYDDPSAVGSVFKSLANGSALGLALRNTPRVVPVIVLGMAGLLAGGVGALAARPRLRLVVAGVVVGCVVVGFAPVWRHGYLAAGAQRSEDVPEYWQDAASALDAEGDATRVLEIPGSLFAAYRWGNTVEPVTPGLMDRPYVARELLPYGTAASVNLLAALDRRIQDGTLDSAALAPLARFLRVGTIALRSDLEYERYDTPRPRLLWRWLTEPAAPGLGPPRELGPNTPNRAAAALAMFDALELGSTGVPWPPAVALFPVLDAQPIVDAKSARRPVVLSGDGDGIVDASTAGLLDGRELVQYAATLDDKALRSAIERDADLVLTDSARRRARRWDVLRGDVGATERAGQRPLGDDTVDQRLDQIPGMTDADRTVVEQEVVRVSARTLERAGAAGQERRLAVVLTRLRQVAESGRVSAEATLVRSLRLPRARGFSLAGTARVAAGGPDELVDAVLGTTAAGTTFTSSGRLAGVPDARASRAFDGDAATAWSAPLGVQEGQWLDARFDAPTTVGGPGALTVVADGRHSVPTRLRVEVDGVAVASVDVPPIPDGTTEGATATVPFELDPMVATDLRIVVETTRPVVASDGTVAPLAFTEVTIPGITPAGGTATVPSPCRNDLVSVDGQPVPVEVRGATNDAARGLTIVPCGDPLSLSAGRHQIVAAPGSATGLDVDQLVLMSAAGGGPATDARARLGAPPPAVGARVRVVHSGPTSFDLKVDTDGEPFWLVLGQSLSDGWKLQTSSGHSLGEPQLVDGFANGWLVKPGSAGTLRLELRWTPQRFVWWGLGLSAAAVVVCLALLVLTRRRRREDPGLVASSLLASPLRYVGAAPSLTSAVFAGLCVGAGAALASRPVIGLGVGLATVVASRVRTGRVLLTGGAPLALLAAKVFEAPEMGWVAILLLGADLVVDHQWRTAATSTDGVEAVAADQAQGT